MSDKCSWPGCGNDSFADEDLCRHHKNKSKKTASTIKKTAKTLFKHKDKVKKFFTAFSKK